MTTPGKHRGAPTDTMHRTTDDARLAAAEAAASEHLAGWQRARADYENLQKDLKKRLAEASETSKDLLLRGLLPLVDYFDAASQHVPDTFKAHPWTEGILQIRQAFHAFLAEQGVEAIGTVGDALDPELHESVAEDPSEMPPGTITAVVIPGYARNGRVLRPARVKISKESPAS